MMMNIIINNNTMKMWNQLKVFIRKLMAMVKIRGLIDESCLIIMATTLEGGIEMVMGGEV